jgi:hypothetical protein
MTIPKKLPAGLAIRAKRIDQAAHRARLAAARPKRRTHFTKGELLALRFKAAVVAKDVDHAGWDEHKEEL